MADDEETKSVQPILPPAVKRRVNALKKIQLESLNVEAEFFNEVYQLECKYHNRFKAFYDKREKIVSGAVEPTDEEANFKVPGEDSDVDEVEKELQKKLVLSNPTPEDIKGIPDFWLTIFTNVDILSEMIQPHDEPILRHLYDVQVTLTEGKMGFLLKFLFHPNPYFTNPYLTKEYEIKCQPETTDPWSFEGPEIYKCTGCKIDWNKNMNVTVKTIKKRQKHKSKGAVRTVVKSVENDSFFNFFNPPPVPDNGELDDEVQALLTCDFEIGHYIREKIIPRAVLYFTGEALEDPDYEDDEEEESSADSDRNSSDDDDDMEAIEPDSDGSDDHKKRPAKDGLNKNKGKSRKDGGKQQPAQPQECAQQ